MKYISNTLLSGVIAALLISTASQVGTSAGNGNLALVNNLSGYGAVTRVAEDLAVPAVDTELTFQAFAFNSPANFGEDRRDILLLQEFLKEKGYLAVENPTSYFGPATQAALRKFQDSKKIPLTGQFDQATLAAVNDELVNDPPTGFRPPSDGDFCPAPIDQYAVAGWTFPPTNEVPPLPPPNTKPYVPGEGPGHYVCRNFAQDFCEAEKKAHPDVLCSVVTFDGHAANKIEYTDSNGVSWVCFVEPQKNNVTPPTQNQTYTCMTKEAWQRILNNEGEKAWLTDTLCKRYYGISDSFCDVLHYLNEFYFYERIVPYVGSCADAVVGSECPLSSSGKPAYCSAGNGSYEERYCDCEKVYHLPPADTTISCTWKTPWLSYPGTRSGTVIETTNQQ